MTGRHGEGPSGFYPEDPSLGLAWADMGEYLAWEQAWCACEVLCTCEDGRPA